MVNLRLVLTSPSTETDHGEVRNFWAFFAGSVFVDAEFVEIVVVGDFFEGVLFFGGAEGALCEVGEFRSGVRRCGTGR